MGDEHVMAMIDRLIEVAYADGLTGKTVWSQALMDERNHVIAALSAAPPAEPVGCVHNWHDYGTHAGRNLALCTRCEMISVIGREGQPYGLPSVAAPAQSAVTDIATLQRERDGFKARLAECFALAGGDTTSSTVDSQAAQAVATVRDLRECYAEALDRTPL